MTRKIYKTIYIYYIPFHSVAAAARSRFTLHLFITWQFLAGFFFTFFVFNVSQEISWRVHSPDLIAKEFGKIG
jgi:hypothetical protein